MGLMDNVNKLKGVVEGQGDKIADGIDKATDLIDDKTGGKFTDKLEKVDGLADKLREDETPAEG